MKFLVLNCLISCAVLNALAQENRGGSSEIPLASPTGKVYALVVGISDYESPMINDLKYAAADARSVAEYLKTAPIKLQTLIELYDKDAKRSSINEKGLRKIDDLVFDHSIKPEDIIFVYLSGHGGAFTKNDSYFFPHDAAHTTDAGTSFSIKRIKGYIRSWATESRATVIFVFDACRSATLAKGQTEMDLGEVSKYLEEDTGEVLMAASQGGEPAQETSELRHGVFSFYLLEGLYGKADKTGDNLVSTAELKSYIDNHVSDKTAMQQQPMIKYPAGTQGKILVQVEPRLLATVDAKLKLDLSNQNVILLAQKGGTGNAKAIELSDLIGKFNASMKEGRLIRPAETCAYYYYQQMTTLVPANTLNDYLTDLNIALYDAALAVVKHDLAGERLYLRHVLNDTESKSKSKGLNLNYYKDATLSMKAYIDLKKKDIEPGTYAIYEYLMGRDLTIQFLASDYEDKKLIISAENGLKKAAEKYSEQAFLWQGLAMAYLPDSERDYKLTEDAAAKASKLAPQWSYPLITLAECYLDQKKDEESSAYLKKAVELNQQDYISYFLLGNFLLDQEKEEEALIQYKKAIQLNPDDPEMYFNHGVTFLHLRRYEEAITEFQRAVQLRTDDADTYFNLGVAFADLGRPEEAVTQYQKAIQLNPNDPDTYFNLGLAFSNLEKHEEAVVQYKKSIEIQPDGSDPYNNLGMALSDLGRNEEAIVQYQKSIQLAPKYFEPYNNWGVSLNALGHNEEAVPQYLKAIELKQDDPRVYNNLGNALADLGRNEEAVAQYLKAIELKDHDPVVYSNLGNVLTELGRREEAIIQVKKAIALDPNEISSYLVLVPNLSVMGRSSEAIAQLQKFIKAKPDEADAYFLLGFVLFDLARYNEAAIECQKAVALAPDDGWSLYYLGRSYDKLKKPAKAIEYYAKALKNAADDLALQAWCNLRLNNNAEAEKIFKQIINDTPTNLSSRTEYASFLTLTGRTSDAIEQFRLAFERGYKDWRELEHDDDLKLLRKSPAFIDLVNKYKK